MLGIIVFSIWLVVAVGVWVWDAFIGFGVEFYNEEVLVIIFLWPIVLPLLGIGCFSRFLSKVKSQRLTAAGRN